MQFEEETLEILEPNAAMSPILKALDAALAAHTGPDPQPPQEFAWEEIPFAEVARTAAAFPLLFEGWAEGAIPATEYSAGDLLHELSSDLDIMSAEDLHERFLLLVEGSRASADFRRIMAASSVKHLVRNEAGLGWSGFEVVPKNTELLERMRRKRMAADHFRGKLDWTALRGWDLALGAALITKAQAADMLTNEEALDYFRRIAGELLLRMTSRQALARAMLLGTFWTTLEVGEQQAAEGLRQAEQALDSLLSPEGVWGRTPWVQQKADADPPTVYV